MIVNRIILPGITDVDNVSHHLKVHFDIVKENFKRK